MCNKIVEYKHTKFTEQTTRTILHLTIPTMQKPDWIKSLVSWEYILILTKIELSLNE
jgi:hypothetical protein